MAPGKPSGPTSRIRATRVRERVSAVPNRCTGKNRILWSEVGLAHQNCYDDCRRGPEASGPGPEE
jgi:hypothetical protein